VITIHKFIVYVEDRPVVNMDPTARIVEVRPGPLSTLNVWAIVDTDHPLEPRQFAIHGTGHPIPPGERYVGTAPGPTFVWHLFEVAS